jgi:hypothetical protein
MTNQDQKLRQLLQLKKAETPGPAYFEAFLDEFHCYQRSEILHEPSFAEKASRIFSSCVEALQVRPQPAFATLGGSLALVLLAGFLAVGNFSPSGSVASVASHTEANPGYVTAPIVPAQLISHPEELGLASTSSFDKDFGSPRYVTGQAPGTYDSTIAF